MNKRIEIHVITYNEQIMLPFTINHYRKMFGDNFRMIVHDNNSTDDTVMLAKLAGCEVIPFTTEGMNDTVHRMIKSEAVMNCTADWCLVLDCDECCLITTEDLIALDNKGVNIVHFQGWDVFDDVNRPEDIEVLMGCQSPGYSKPVLVRTGQFKEVEFGAGAHNVEKLVPNDEQETVWSRDEYKLLHYKHWSRKWHLDRSHELGARQSQENLQRRYSIHFAFPDAVHRDWFENHYKSREPIIDKRIV